ncbi:MULTISPECIES: hypothetical protein [Mycobacterium]|uniref:hypothetical protein n=1 Tax=Mycobacterium TaxID=1763 RepID=UPI001EE196FB|nr:MULTISPECIES: hypothetical protein [Mycobacterium]GLD01499.1 hypothetical protein Mkiyose1088_33650 [Mycobacterium kiyosense]
MTQQSPVRPVWAAKALLRAIWVAEGESPKWIAERCDALVQALQAIFGVERWEKPPRSILRISSDLTPRSD